MDINTMIQLINGVGFPIFCCIALGAYIVWDRKERRAARLESDAIIDKLSDTVAQNTIVVQKLIDRMDGK